VPGSYLKKKAVCVCEESGQTELGGPRLRLYVLLNYSTYWVTNWSGRVWAGFFYQEEL